MVGSGMCVKDGLSVLGVCSRMSKVEVRNAFFFQAEEGIRERGPFLGFGMV